MPSLAGMMEKSSSGKHHFLNDPSVTKIQTPKGSDDLLTKMRLLPMYEQYVEPYKPPMQKIRKNIYEEYTSDLSGRVEFTSQKDIYDLVVKPDFVPTKIVKFDPDTLRELRFKPGAIESYDASWLSLGDDGTKKPIAVATAGSVREANLEANIKRERRDESMEGEGGSEKKKKKKKKHKHEHSDGKHSEHRKKKKRKKDKDGHNREHRHGEDEDVDVV